MFNVACYEVGKEKTRWYLMCRMKGAPSLPTRCATYLASATQRSGDWSATFLSPKKLTMQSPALSWRRSWWWKTLLRSIIRCHCLGYTYWLISRYSLQDCLLNIKNYRS